MSTNPFQDNQNTTGAKAGFGAFESLRIDKEYDDETLKANPGAPLPAPAGTVPEFLDARNNVNARDYERLLKQWMIFLRENILIQSMRRSSKLLIK
jgi:hypothetical protein